VTFKKMELKGARSRGQNVTMLHRVENQRMEFLRSTADLETLADDAIAGQS